MPVDKEWDKEFKKYVKDFIKESREKYPKYEMSWWSHYPIEKTGLRDSPLGETAYQFLGHYPFPDNRPEIPGYMKIHAGFGLHNELGVVVEITTDEEDEHA